MTIRRKLKGERELVADIHKRFRMFCRSQECRYCMFDDYDDCEMEYVKYILKKHNEEESGVLHVYADDSFVYELEDDE